MVQGVSFWDCPVIASARSSRDIVKFFEASFGSRKAVAHTWLSRDLDSNGLRREFQPFIKMKLHHTIDRLVAGTRIHSEAVNLSSPRPKRTFMRQFGSGPGSRQWVSTQTAYLFWNGLLKICSRNPNCMDTIISPRLKMKHVNIGSGLREIPISQYRFEVCLRFCSTTLLQLY